MSTFVCALLTLPPQLIAYVLSPAGALDRVYPTPANAIVFQGYGLLTFHGPSPPRPRSGVLPLQASLASSVDFLFAGLLRLRQTGPDQLFCRFFPFSSINLPPTRNGCRPAFCCRGLNSASFSCRKVNPASFPCHTCILPRTYARE